MIEENSTNPPAQRHRACAAILKDGQILMVRHADAARTYWTLPGGGVEADETAEEAAVREVWEETGLRARVMRFLFSEGYAAGTCDCFLLMLNEEKQTLRSGYDPEEAHLPPNRRLLQEAAWVPLANLTHDGQVQQVMAHLLRYEAKP